MATGRPFTERGLLERVDDLVHVVTVDAEHVPTEASVFCGQGLDVHHIFNPSIDLQAVAINDRDQVIELVMSRFHCGFPDLTFLLLAIAHDAEDLVTLLVEAGGQRHSYGDAQTLAQRSGRSFHTRQLQPMRMTLKW